MIDFGEISVMKKVRVESGDVVVIQAKARLSGEMQNRLRNDVSQSFGELGVKVLVLDESLELSVVSAEQLPPQVHSALLPKPKGD